VGTPLATLAIISHERPRLRDRAAKSLLVSLEHAGASLPVLVIESSRDPQPAPDGVQLVHVPHLNTCVSKRRLAIEMCRTDWVIMLDDDCLAAPGAIGEMLAAMGSADHRQTGALFVTTEFAGAPTWMFNAALHSDLAAGFGLDDADGGDVSWAVTTLSAFRKDAALATGIFPQDDLALPAAGEDVDACVRLRAEGWRLRKLAGVLAMHEIETWNSFWANARRSLRYGAAEALLVRLHHQHARIGYETFLVSAAFGVLCASVLPGRSGGWWRPALAGLSGWAAGVAASLHQDHPEASAAEVLVQVAWSAAYESGRLRTAISRRALQLAVQQFNWHDAEPARFTCAPHRSAARRLIITGLAAAAAVVGLRHAGRRR